MLNKLYFDGMFHRVYITQKDEKLFSIQTQEHGRARRFLRFDKSFFIDIGDGEKSMVIDVKKIMNVTQDIPDNKLIDVTNNDTKIIISAKREKHSIGWKYPKEEILTSVPFTIENRVYTVYNREKNIKIPLEVYFTVEKKSFKRIGNHLKNYRSKFTKFYFLRGKLKIRVGGLQDSSDFVTLEPKSEIKNGKQLSVIVLYGMKEIGNTFDGDIHIRTKTDSPMWIYESSDEGMTHGLMIAPFVFDDLQ